MSVDWLKIKTEYVQTTKSLQDIAEEFSVNYYYLKKKAANEHWNDEKKEYRELLRQKVSKGLLERLEKEASSTLERNIARAESWRYMEATLMALVQSMEVISPITGLPKAQIATEIGRKVSVLKDASIALERCYLGERLELGQNTSMRDDDITLEEFKTSAMRMREYNKLSDDELAAKVEILIKERLESDRIQELN